MNFTLAELTRLKLEPGEVLAVKFYGDDYDHESMRELQNKLKELFPHNKVMVFMLPNGTDLQMEAISPKLADSENNALAVSEELKPAYSDCSAPASYCSDCNCGKKERIEGK